MTKEKNENELAETLGGIVGLIGGGMSLYASGIYFEGLNTMSLVGITTAAVTAGIFTSYLVGYWIGHALNSIGK